MIKRGVAAESERHDGGGGVIKLYIYQRPCGGIGGRDIEMGGLCMGAEVRHDTKNIEWYYSESSFCQYRGTNSECTY
jgi:hypothetical protein